MLFGWLNVPLALAVFVVFLAMLAVWLLTSPWMTEAQWSAEQDRQARERELLALLRQADKQTTRSKQP